MTRMLKLIPVAIEDNMRIAMNTSVRPHTKAPPQFVCIHMCVYIYSVYIYIYVHLCLYTFESHLVRVVNHSRELHTTDWKNLHNLRVSY